MAPKEYGRRPLIVVGKTNTSYGKQLLKRYGGDPHVRFVGGSTQGWFCSQQSEGDKAGVFLG